MSTKRKLVVAAAVFVVALFVVVIVTTALDEGAAIAVGVGAAATATVAATRVGNAVREVNRRQHDAARARVENAAALDDGKTAAKRAERLADLGDPFSR